MQPGWIPVIFAPYLFWLAGIAASCFTATVSNIAAQTGLGLSLLLLVGLLNSHAASQRVLMTPQTVVAAIVTLFAILMTWLAQPTPRDPIVHALLFAAGVLQALLILFMLILLLLGYRRRWRRRTLLVFLLFLACAALLLADAVWQRSALLGAMTVVAMTMLLLAFLLWLTSPGGVGALGAALLTLAAALALLASLVLGTLNLATMFLLMFLWTLVILLVCSTLPSTAYLLTRWLLYLLALLLLTSALLAAGNIFPTATSDSGGTDFVPDVLCLLLLITAGILFILAILTEWGSGSKTFGPVFMCLSGVLTTAAGILWLVLSPNVLYSAWIVLAGNFIVCIALALFGILKFCRYCCFCCLNLEAEERPPTPYRNDV